MEIFKFNILPLAEVEKREDFKRSIYNCPVCGSSLSFDYEPEPENELLQETASCETCQTQVRTEIHRRH